MSRIGRQPIKIPDNVEIKIRTENIHVKGPKGELEIKVPSQVKLEQKNQEVTLQVSNPNDKKEKALWGTFRQLIFNLIKGTVEGFEKKLELSGIGYKASVSGNILTLNVGFSHPIEYKLPPGIETKIEKNIISIFGINKQLVGEIAAQIRRIRPPEPYKGRGIKYVEEIIRKKAGKQAKVGEGAEK